jgi:hypothetical protein
MGSCLVSKRRDHKELMLVSSQEKSAEGYHVVIESYVHEMPSQIRNPPSLRNIKKSAREISC